MGKFANALYPGQEEVTVQIHCEVPVWFNENGIDIYAKRLEEYAEDCHDSLRTLGVIAGSSAVAVYKREMHARLTLICKDPEHHEKIRTQLSQKLSDAFNNIYCVSAEDDIVF